MLPALYIQHKLYIRSFSGLVFSVSFYLSLRQIIRDMRTIVRNSALLILLSLALSLNAGAQTAKMPVLTPAIPDGSFIWQRLDVEASSEISDLLKQQYDLNRKTGTFSGYRLQLYFGSGVNARAHAEKVRSEFNNLFPDMKVYLSFKSPDFIVRAGDFRSRSEALKVLRSLTPGFANAFIVTDEINSPVLTVQGETK